MYNRAVRSEKTIAKPSELFVSVFTAEGASRNVVFRAGKLGESDQFKINTQGLLEQVSQ